MKTNKEAIVLRANILGGLNSYIIDEIGNDDATNLWLTYGIPDGATEDDLMEIAADEKEFAGILFYAGYLIDMNVKGFFNE